jgi:hypothetical protein
MEPANTTPDTPPEKPEPMPLLAATSSVPPSKRRKSGRLLVLAIVLVALAAGLAIGCWIAHKHTAAPASTSSATVTSNQTTPATTDAASGLQLDATKNYGNLYANGVLPVGDGKYTTSGPKKGSLYTCSQYAQNLAREAGGAGKRGPWFINGNTQYDITKKPHVNGSVVWKPSFSNTLSGDSRSIMTNDLPSHPTGLFPIMRSDPVYSYDGNPNSIKSQSLTFTLAANPTYGSPNCMGGQSGVMLTGVALFNALDAAGRDAGAWEVQDDCGGHPEKQGEYHYHTLSSCITDRSVHDVIGYALDGFPITGPKVGTNNLLTTNDLDECHGLTSQIVLDGKQVTMYHYVMTQDFPYSVSCFRSKPINPPGLPQGSSPGQSGAAS